MSEPVLVGMVVTLRTDIPTIRPLVLGTVITGELPVALPFT